MKKSFLITLAALAVVSQAHAQSRELKPESLRRLETQKAAESAAKGTNANMGASRAVRAFDLSQASKDLSPSARLRLTEVLANDKNADALSVVKQVSAQSDRSEVRDLIAATIEGVSNLKGIDRSANAQAIAQMGLSARADQAYVTLVLTIAKNAIGTNKFNALSEPTRNVVESLLKKSNSFIASGKTQGEALTLAAREVEVEETARARKQNPQAEEFKLDLDDLIKFCKG